MDGDGRILDGGLGNELPLSFAWEGIDEGLGLTLALRTIQKKGNKICKKRKGRNTSSSLSRNISKNYISLCF